MSNITIREDYTLPSMGQIYNQKFDPLVKLRSMTVQEEMKRLTPSDTPYKSMCEIIDDCLEEKLPISSYDMCLGDYQYLLHKLRTVTYGPEYNVNIMCPSCGERFDFEINLDELDVFNYNQEVENLKTVTLPTSGKIIGLRFQTPRDLDEIDKKRKALKKQFPDMTDDPTFMLTIESVIDTIDGQVVNPVFINEFVKKLPMKDSLLLIQTAEKLNSKVGIDTKIEAVCPNCYNDVDTVFRFTSEFFRPEIR